LPEQQSPEIQTKLEWEKPCLVYRFEHKGCKPKGTDAEPVTIVECSVFLLQLAEERGYKREAPHAERTAAPVSPVR
jgi:hypothetical protein